jgi:hypothetical protein
MLLPVTGSTVGKGIHIITNIKYPSATRLVAMPKRPSLNEPYGIYCPRIFRIKMKRMGGTYETFNENACRETIALNAVVEMR